MPKGSQKQTPNTPNARLKGASPAYQAQICIEEAIVWLHAYEELLPNDSSSRARVREMQEDLAKHHGKLSQLSQRKSHLSAAASRRLG